MQQKIYASILGQQGRMNESSPSVSIGGDMEGGSQGSPLNSEGWRLSSFYLGTTLAHHNNNNNKF